MSKIYNVFISHAWDYNDEAQIIRNFLDKKPYLKVEYLDVNREHAIQSKNPDYIKRVLKQKILNSHIVVGMAGLYASHSEWMQWEIKTAYNNNIPIIGIRKRGALVVSNIIRIYAKEVVNWNSNSIVNAIRKYSL